MTKEYSGFDALSHALELIHEAHTFFDINGFDWCDTADLVEARWQMQQSGWWELFKNLDGEVTQVLDGPTEQPDGTWIAPGFKKARRKWDNAGLVAAARRKFVRRVPNADGELVSMLDEEILEVMQPNKGRSKQWRERVFDGDWEAMEEYAGEVVEERTLVETKEKPDES